MNVLIVDDDKLARKGLIAVIDWEQYGLCVVGDVQNGKKALEFLENHPVDLVFTDIDMPEMNGLELMKICKENYPETDFVIFSVYEDFSFARQALRLGALDYIPPAFCPEDLRNISPGEWLSLIRDLAEYSASVSYTHLPSPRD